MSGRPGRWGLLLIHLAACSPGTDLPAPEDTREDTDTDLQDSIALETSPLVDDSDGASADTDTPDAGDPPEADQTGATDSVPWDPPPAPLAHPSPLHVFVQRRLPAR